MKKCTICGQEDLDEMNFCTGCGQKYPEQPPQQPQVETPQQPQVETPQQPQVETPQQPQVETPQQPQVETPQQARIVFPSSEIFFEEHQKAIGRSELSDEIKNQGKDPLQVSRKHFTIYSNSGKYYIVDGVTSVQEKPSSNHTKVNGIDITEKGEIELHAGDQIEVATIITATFEEPSNSESSSNSNASNPPPATNNQSNEDIVNKYDNMPDL